MAESLDFYSNESLDLCLGGAKACLLYTSQVGVSNHWNGMRTGMEWNDKE